MTLSTAKALVRLHREKGEEILTKEIVDEYVKSREQSYKNGTLSRRTFQKNRKSAEYLMQIYNTRTFIPYTHNSLPPLPESFEHILSDILANELWGVKFRKNQHHVSGTFFRWLISHGYNEVSCIDESVVKEYLTDCSSRMLGSSLYTARRTLKTLLLFMSEHGTLSENMSRLFLFRMPVYTPQNTVKKPIYALLSRK